MIITVADRPGHPLRLALLVGAIHVALVLGFAGYVAWLGQANVAQWQLAWRPLQRLDWPASLLLFSLPAPQGPIPWLPWPIDAPRAFLMPALVFGIVGALQYAVIGYLTGLLRGVLSPHSAGRPALSE